MILRKPYAFFIKYFKIFHLIISFIIGYLIFNTNKLINFFSTYLKEAASIVGQSIVSEYFSSYVYIALGLIIIITLIIFSVMFKKNKPYKFYIINIFVYIAITVVFVYTRSILISMETLILNIRVVKLMHDILVLSVMFESVTLIVFITRGLGLNFKKFDFSSDINKFEIDSKDREEFEVNVDLDISGVKKDFRKKIRFFKYNFLESKTKIFLSLIIIFVLLISIIIYSYFNREKIYSEGNLISFNGIDYVVNSSYLVKKNNKYLLVVDINSKSFYKNKTMYLNDLYINIEGYKFKNTLKYCSILSEYGICYQDENLSSDYSNYILVYEIPEIYTNSRFVFEYDIEDGTRKTKLNVINESVEKNNKNYKLGDLIEFDDKILKGVSFKINFIDISNSYKIDYVYNNGKRDIASVEYLRPSLDTNFDKTILKLNIEYTSSNKNYKTFFSVFNKYGKIRYYIKDVEYIQKLEFEDINGSRTILDDKYIGVDRQILSAEKVELLIDVRSNRYVYSIKGDN